MPTVVSGSVQLSALVICTVLLEDSLQPAARSHHIKPHPTQTGPHGQLVCCQHRFVELTFQRSNNVVGRKVSASNEHRVCVWIITFQNQVSHGSVLNPPDPTAQAQILRSGHEHT